MRYLLASIVAVVTLASACETGSRGDVASCDLKQQPLELNTLLGKSYEDGSTASKATVDSIELIALAASKAASYDEAKSDHVKAAFCSKTAVRAYGGLVGVPGDISARAIRGLKERLAAAEIICTGNVSVGARPSFTDSCNFISLWRGTLATLSADFELRSMGSKFGPAKGQTADASVWTRVDQQISQSRQELLQQWPNLDNGATPSSADHKLDVACRMAVVINDELPFCPPIDASERAVALNKTNQWFAAASGALQLKNDATKCSVASSEACMSSQRDAVMRKCKPAGV